MTYREPSGCVSVLAHFASFTFAVWLVSMHPSLGAVVFVGAWAVVFAVLVALPSVWATVSQHLRPRSSGDRASVS